MPTNCETPGMPTTHGTQSRKMSTALSHHHIITCYICIVTSSYYHMVHAHDARHAEQGAEHWCVLPEILLRVSETNIYTDIQITDCPGWGGAEGQRRGRDTWKYRWPKLKIRPMYMTKETDVYDNRYLCI